MSADRFVASAPAEPGRDEPLLPNALIVAGREFRERVRSRLFFLSTLLLASLAVLVAFTPVFVRAIDRGTSLRVAVVTTDDALAEQAEAVLDGVLNGGLAGPRGEVPAYEFVRRTDPAATTAEVENLLLDAALVVEREPNGRLSFTFYSGETVGADRAQLVAVGALAVAILDWTSNLRPTDGPAFQMPRLDLIAAGGPSAGGVPLGGAEFASRRILGIVFVVLVFITTIIYGMWVAAGVVAEKSGRVMELLLGAASPAQLVVGKVVGIGLAGALQFVVVLTPALVALVAQERLGEVLFGPGGSLAGSLVALSPGLLAAFAVFFVLGFALYALVYAGVGSLVSRPEDLQVISLPLSLIAIAGYLQAVLALTGGTAGFVRFASYVPFWSPFVMLTRLAVGRVEAWELALAVGLLLVTIPVVAVVAIRVYATGVLLYGQRPSVTSFVRAAIRRAG
ncbi:MAG TPA: ABC transporter permease [Candidatus Binatia bacterium]|nr:ABC transporter permease [Candidatus Binatia bacterium]